MWSRWKTAAHVEIKTLSITLPFEKGSTGNVLVSQTVCFVKGILFKSTHINRLHLYILARKWGWGLGKIASERWDYKDILCGPIIPTCIIWAACSGVPCLRSCSLTANTRSLLQRRPSLAARPPSNRSRINTPASSVRRTSLIPSCSDDSRLCRVMRMLAGLPLGEAGATGGLAEQRRSLRTVNCRVAQGRASVERAKVCGTLLISTLFTWKQMGSVENLRIGLMDFSRLRFGKWFSSPKNENYLHILKLLQTCIHFVVLTNTLRYFDQCL